MSQSEIGFPETSKTSDGNYMKAGLVRMRIDKITEWLNYKTKKPMTDKRGYPGLEITFVNEADETIKDGFYYSKEPANSPTRSDKDQKCKSEFLLANLKKALGFGTEAVTVAQLKSKWCWGAVGEEVYVDGQGNPTGTKYSFLIKKFFPDGAKPGIIGDPDLPQSNGIASDIFYKETVDRKNADATTSVPDRTAPTAPKPDADQVKKADDDMPVDDGVDEF